MDPAMARSHTAVGQHGGGEGVGIEATNIRNRHAGAQARRRAGARARRYAGTRARARAGNV